MLTVLTFEITAVSPLCEQITSLSTWLMSTDVCSDFGHLLPHWHSVAGTLQSMWRPNRSC